jgi:hypothetical protein
MNENTATEFICILLKFQMNRFWSGWRRILLLNLSVFYLNFKKTDFGQDGGEYCY